MKPYILDDASTLEHQRLDLMSKILDPWTQAYLTALGISQGWQCLELGSGNGSIVEWLCTTVSPSGSVTAIDIDPVLLELIPAQNLTVEQMDVRTGQLPANAYDLVSCRALLHQISDYAPAVLAQMAAALKPGGWLLIQEPDFHLAPTTEPEGVGKDLEGPDRVGARQWDRLANRPQATEHGQHASSGATTGQDRCAEHPWPGSWGVAFLDVFR
jgi:SAM-dependent methyltransferase